MDGHKAPMTARFPRPTASRPLLQTAPATKLLPVVQLRSGVILLMGDLKAAASTELPGFRGQCGAWFRAISVVAVGYSLARVGEHKAIQSEPVFGQRISFSM